VLEEDADFEKRRADVSELFEPNLYVKFREQPILKSAVEFARDRFYKTPFRPKHFFG
jgi:hypothetical protein